MSLSGVALIGKGTASVSTLLLGVQYCLSRSAAHARSDHLLSARCGLIAAGVSGKDGPLVRLVEKAELCTQVCLQISMQVFLTL